MPPAPGRLSRQVQVEVRPVLTLRGPAAAEVQEFAAQEACHGQTTQAGLFLRLPHDGGFRRFTFFDRSLDYLYPGLRDTHVFEHEETTPACDIRNNFQDGDHDRF